MGPIHGAAGNFGIEQRNATSGTEQGSCRRGVLNSSILRNLHPIELQRPGGAWVGVIRLLSLAKFEAAGSYTWRLLLPRLGEAPSDSRGGLDFEGLGIGRFPRPRRDDL